MKRVTLATCLAFTLLALGACGSSTTDRALSGGGIGAGVGALGGLAVGSPVTGAVIGGAVGAGAGALTDEDDIDLGKPIWRQTGASALKAIDAKYLDCFCCDSDRSEADCAKPERVAHRCPSSNDLKLIGDQNKGGSGASG